MLFGNNPNDKMNTSNIVEYQYQLYNEYLGRTKTNIQNYSQNPELAIKYWKIDHERSTNINNKNTVEDLVFNAYSIPATDNETERISGTGIAHKFRNFTYSIFEFTPVIEIQPLTYENAEEQSRGTSSSMSIMSIDKPNAGDLFTFYGAQDGTTDAEELFQITEVSYQRTSHNKLPIYLLTFRSAPMLVQTLKEVQIHEVYFYSIHFNKFLKSTCWDNYQYSLKFFNDNNARTFKDMYLQDKSKYIFRSCYKKDIYGNDISTRSILPMVFNNIIKRLSSLIKTGFKNVLDFSTNISLNEFLFGAVHPTIVDSDGNNKIFNFVVFRNEELYNIYAGMGYTDELNPVQAPLPSTPESTEITWDPDTGEEIINIIPAGPVIWEEEITTDSLPVAFIDKDLFSKKFIVIDSSTPEGDENIWNFNKYLELWNITSKVQSLYYCEAGVDPFDSTLSQEEQSLTQYDDNARISNNKYYNIWECSGDIENTESNLDNLTNYMVGNIYDANGVLMDYSQRRILIGDLGLPLVISFQYGVAYY